MPLMFNSPAPALTRPALPMMVEPIVALATLTVTVGVGPVSASGSPSIE